MQEKQDTTLRTSFNTNNIFTAINTLIMRKPPSIIPGLEPTAGNIRFANDLWKQMYNLHVRGKTIEHIPVAFLRLYPKKTDQINRICQWFSHTMGLNYEVFSDEFNRIQMEVTRTVHPNK